MSNDPYRIIIRPVITERTTQLAMGNPRLPDDQLVRRYTFQVEPNATKIDIKRAVEAIYNEGKGKKDAKIVVTAVNTIHVRGKMRRVGQHRGRRSDWKKAIVTLLQGQRLEDFGV